jgi:hypothetical protein
LHKMGVEHSHPQPIISSQHKGFLKAMAQPGATKRSGSS